MKILSFLVLMATNLNGFFGIAQDSTKVFFNEAQISLNLGLALSSQSNDWGFGGGLYHVFKNRKHLHWVAGIAYNYNQIFGGYQYISHFSHNENVIYKLNYLSIPLSSRFILGRKTQLFLEPGVFLDISLGGHYSGTFVNYSPDSNGKFIYEYKSFNGKISQALGNPGISFALGSSLPIQKHRLSLRAEFKFGFIPLFEYMSSLYVTYYRLTLAYSW